MRTKRNVWIGMMVSLLVISSTVRADDREKYKAYAEEVRKEVWALDLPAFRNPTVPEKYKQESAVVLAAHSRVEVSKKTRFNVGAFIGGFHYIDREVNCRDLYRMLVQINDKNALKEFSEFDYKAEIKKKEWRYDEKSRYVLGVRIIKPDGSVREVDTDEYMTATEGKNDREQRQKLAVPGLEVGDKIDLFFMDNTALENHNLEPFVFRFRQSHPMLSYSVHCEVDDKLTVQYRTLNGAPDFRQGKDEEGNILLDVEVTDVEQVEPALWYNAIRQSPMTLMYITNSKMKKYTYIPPSTRETGVQANPDAAIILSDDTDFLNLAQKGINTGGLTAKSFRKLYKQSLQLKKKKTWSDEQKADYLYTLYHLALLNERESDYNPTSFILAFGTLLGYIKIYGHYKQTVSNRNEPLEQLISYRNASWIFELNEGGKRYYPLTACLVPGEIPSAFQGESGTKFLNIRQKDYEEKKKERYFTLPCSTADDNCDTRTIHAKVDGTLLAIDRTETLTGVLKEKWQTDIATLEQVDAALRRDLGITTRWVDEVDKKYAADLQERFRKGREQEKENYKSEINYYHGTNAKELLSYRLQSLGNRADSSALIYNVCYTLEGCVRKAGTDLLLTVGKLIGEQMKIEGEERERCADISMSAARTFQWDITVNLPAGYYVGRRAWRN